MVVILSSHPRMSLFLGSLPAHGGGTLPAEPAGSSRDETAGLSSSDLGTISLDFCAPGLWGLRRVLVSIRVMSPKDTGQLLHRVHPASGRQRAGRSSPHRAGPKPPVTGVVEEQLGSSR